MASVALMMPIYQQRLDGIKKLLKMTVKVGGGKFEK